MLALSVSADAATIQVTMETLVISPAEASAKVGDTIEWINKDVIAHTATARNGDWDVMMPPNVMTRTSMPAAFARQPLLGVKKI